VSDADELIPFSADFRRRELELFAPEGYLARRSPPFVESFVRSPDAVTVATELDPYLDAYAPRADAVRDEPALHVFMVNRCGSTALVNALARLSDVAAFNELDPWALSDTEPRLDEALGAHLLGWARAAGRRLVLKHRGEMIVAAPRLVAGFPRARAVFLVRHYEPVIASLLAGPPSSFPGPVTAEIERLAPSLLAWSPALRAELHAAFYVDIVARYRALAASPHGAAVSCLRYETLAREPVGAVHAVAEWFGLAVGDSLAAVRVELGLDAKARAGGADAAFAPRTVRPLPALRPEIRDALEAAWSTPLPGELTV
jgi:hypothetical protein